MVRRDPPMTNLFSRPIRMTARRVAAFAALAFALWTAPAAAQRFETAATHAILMDADSGAVLFEKAEVGWNGISPDELKQQRIVWPDFHHDPDLLKSGAAVSFLPRDAADRFALWGNAEQIAEQLTGVLRNAPVDFEYVVLQPIPDPRWPHDLESGFTHRVATEVLPKVREALAKAQA